MNRSTSNRALVLGAVLAHSLTASAGTVYKCNIDGKPSFSERPCGNQAEAVTIRPSGRPSGADKALDQSAIDTANLTVCANQFKRDIERHKAQIESDQRARDEELTMLRRMTTYNSAEQNQGLATQMNAAAAKWESDIHSERDQIADTEAKLARLRSGEKAPALCERM